MNLTVDIRDVNIKPICISYHPLKMSAFIDKVYAYTIPHVHIKKYLVYFCLHFLLIGVRK